MSSSSLGEWWFSRSELVVHGLIYVQPQCKTLNQEFEVKCTFIKKLIWDFMHLKSVDKIQYENHTWKELHKVFSFVMKAYRKELAWKTDLFYVELCVASYPFNRPWRLIVLWDVEAPTFSRQSAHRWQRLSALCAGHHLPPGRFLILNSVRGGVDPRAIVQLEGLGKLEKIQWPHQELNLWHSSL
jgi:hypothetical protein